MQKEARTKNFVVHSEVWLYPGMAGWHFTSPSRQISQKIKDGFGNKHRGWGSLPVLVTLGKTKWNTSIFWDKRSGTYLLPLKAEVRKKEGIHARDKITFSITILA